MTYTQPFLPATSQEIPVPHRYSYRFAVERMWTWFVFAFATFCVSAVAGILGSAFLGVLILNYTLYGVDREVLFIGGFYLVLVAPFLVLPVLAFPRNAVKRTSLAAFRYSGPLVVRCIRDERCQCFVEFDGRTLTWTQPSAPDSFDHITWGTVEYTDDVLLALRDVGGNTVYAYNRSVLQILGEII